MTSVNKRIEQTYDGLEAKAVVEGLGLCSINTTAQGHRHAGFARRKGPSGTHERGAIQGSREGAAGAAGKQVPAAPPPGAHRPAPGTG